MRRFTLFTDLLYILLFAAVSGWVYINFLSTIRIVTLPPPIDEEIVEEFDFPEFREYSSPPPKLRPKPPEHVAALLDSVYTQFETTHTYDPAYVKLSYPG
ncbi:MAG: hypothetical protein ACPGSM_22325, partial [Thiolinea sp.]